MPTETLHYENARFAQQLFNNDTQNLRALEETLGLKVTSREGWIRLEGPVEALQQAKQMFQSLEASLKSGTPVRTRDFNYALNVVQHEGAEVLHGLLTERIQNVPQESQRHAQNPGPKEIRRGHSPARCHLWNWSGRHGQNVSGHGHGGVGVAQ